MSPKSRRWSTATNDVFVVKAAKSLEALLSIAVQATKHQRPVENTGDGDLGAGITGGHETGGSGGGEFDAASAELLASSGESPVRTLSSDVEHCPAGPDLTNVAAETPVVEERSTSFSEAADNALMSAVNVVGVPAACDIDRMLSASLDGDEKSNSGKFTSDVNFWPPADLQSLHRVTVPAPVMPPQLLQSDASIHLPQMPFAELTSSEFGGDNERRSLSGTIHLLPLPSAQVGDRPSASYNRLHHAQLERRASVILELADEGAASGHGYAEGLDDPEGNDSSNAAKDVAGLHPDGLQSVKD